MSEDSTAVQEEIRSDRPRVTVKEGYVRRRGHLEFDGDYAGQWADVWTNCPKRVVNGLASDEVATVDRAVTLFVLDHNMTYPLDEEPPEDADEDWEPSFRAGQPMPVPLTLTAVNEIPVDLFRRIVQLGIEALQKAAEVTKRRA